MLAAAAALILSAVAGAHTFTIRGDWKMSSFAVKRDGTLSGAIDAFGQPGTRNRTARCTVRWPRHGLKIVFYNLGGNNPLSAGVRLLLERSREGVRIGGRPRGSR
jgi:hypothetical protein